MKRVYFVLICLLISTLHAFAQEDEETGKSNRLKDFLREGSYEFHTRSFFMTTINRGDLTDYNALAMGGGMGYVSPYMFNLRFGMSGFFIFRLYEHNLELNDPITRATNRYEITLFDMNEPSNQTDLDRLEELFIEYKAGNWQWIAGRQKMHTPFLNEQDNRMRPNLFSGLKGKYSNGGLSVESGLINAVSPRGTVNWYSVENSFGVYPFGRNILGNPSEYKENISSKGIAYLGLNYQTKKINYQLWEYFVENVFNLMFAQADVKLPLNASHVLIGGQGFYQNALSNGGNPDPIKSYILPDESTWGLGLQSGIVYRKHKISLNYLNISNNGRFLFPREWGREIFFASLPRERYEGNGGVDAFTLKYDYVSSNGLGTQLGMGRVNTQDINFARLNKYGMPSYYHLTGTVNYNFSGWAEGLDLKVLAVHKLAQNPESVSDQFRINRVDLWNLNFIVDYRF